MAQTIYIDSTSAATGDNGTEANPYLDFESLVAGDLDAGGLNVINIAGDHFLTQNFNGLKQGSLGNNNVWQQWEGRPQGRLMSAVRIDNNSVYRWTESQVLGEYYLELAGGGDPSVTVESATVDGYYRGKSVATNGGNTKLEQLAADAAIGNAPVIGSLESLEFGYGDGDSLGYDTFYFKPNSTPDSYEIIISSGNGYVDIAFNHQTLLGLHILYGNQTALEIRSRATVENCVVGLSEFIAIECSSASTILTLRNTLMTQSHRGVSVAAGSTVDAANCTVHNAHLGLRVSNSEANVTWRNNLVIGGESGGIEQTVAFTTGSLTEDHNCWYPRLNDSTNKLGYISANWLLTDATDIPPREDTQVVIASATDPSVVKRALPDPLIMKLNLHNWTKCDFHLQTTSALINAGTPIAGLTTDFEGVAYDASNPAIGFYQTARQLSGQSGDGIVSSIVR
jgi:hypothetical protein